MAKESNNIDSAPSGEPPSNNSTQTTHIAITRFSALGDIAMTIPVIDSFARQHQDIRITILSRPYVAKLFTFLPSNVNFIPIDLKHQYKGPKGMWLLAKELKRKGVTHYADFHGVLRTHMLRFFLRLRGVKTESIKKERSGRRTLLRHSLEEPLTSPFKLYADVIRRLGFNLSVNFLSLNMPYNESFDQKLNHVLQTMQCNTKEDKKQTLWLGIAPFAAHKGKIYPPEMMLQVIEELKKSCEDLRLFIFGSKKEMEKIRTEWKEKNKNICFVCDNFSGFDEELHLMSHLDTMISMDSGNMHLASLVALPVVSIWGQTHPYAGFVGWNQSPHNIIGLELDCRPCSIYGNRPCKYRDYHCLTQIKPHDIARKIKSITS